MMLTTSLGKLGKDVKLGVLECLTRYEKMTSSSSFMLILNMRVKSNDALQIRIVRFKLSPLLSTLTGAATEKGEPP